MKTHKSYNHHGGRAKHHLKIANFIKSWMIISIPTKIIHLLLNLGHDEVLTSASIAFLNSSSSLSKIFLYLAHSSDIFVKSSMPTINKWFIKNDVMLIKNWRWIPHDSHKTVLAPAWLILSLSLSNSSMARTKVTPRKEGRNVAEKYKHGPKYKHSQHWWTPQHQY